MKEKDHYLVLHSSVRFHKILNEITEQNKKLMTKTRSVLFFYVECTSENYIIFFIKIKYLVTFSLFIVMFAVDCLKLFSIYHCFKINIYAMIKIEKKNNNCEVINNLYIFYYKFTLCQALHTLLVLVYLIL